MSGIDISIFLFELLNVPEVTNLLDGGIFRFNRPLNSGKRDIVISIPEYNAGQFNTGYIDVNVHVPNLKLSNDQTNPDLRSMEVIVDAVLPRLRSVEGFELDVRIPGIPIRDTHDSWYCNIRVGFAGIDQKLSEDVTLLRLCSTDDGFGGSKPNFIPYWQGKAAKVKEELNDQLSLEAGEFVMEQESEWYLPKDVNLLKGTLMVTEKAQYVIRGFVEENSYLRIKATKKDGKECSTCF